MANVWATAYIGVFGSAAFGFTMLLLSGGGLSPGMAVVAGLSYGLGMAAAMAVLPLVPVILCWNKRIRFPFLVFITLIAVCSTLLVTLSSGKLLTPFAESSLFTMIGMTLLPICSLCYCTEALVVPSVVAMRVKRLSQDAMRAKSLAEFEELIDFCLVTKYFEQASILSEQMMTYAERS